MESVVWSVVAALWALAAWDMVRRWAFAVATRTLAAELTTMRAELSKLSAGVEEDGSRIAKLERLTVALKTHVEMQRAARVSPFARKSG